MSLSDAQIVQRVREIVRATESPHATPPPPPAPAPVKVTPAIDRLKNNFFILYYGAPIDGNFNTIVAADPAFVVLADWVYGKDVADAYAAKNILTLGYIPQGYGNNPVADKIKRVLDATHDGVFFDETDTNKTAYNKACYDAVRAYGPDKLIIVNPGHAGINPDIFNWADIVSVENQWFIDLKRFGVHPKRLLAVQGDPASNTGANYQSADTLDVAVQRLKAFRANGGHWYYSGYRNHHWMIQPFLSQFAVEAKK